ncbi:MAG: PadR family transcriptional regulator [Oscillospiraceae bacterium]|nr:PadR family transcriptional regulator [Oscillospiraceae bacterium]
MDVSKELTAASATPLVLSILSEADSYGYQMIKRVRLLSGNEIVWTEGMLYPVLHRLEDQKLIASYWSEAEGGRKRKYYQITESGRTNLETLMRGWNTVHETLRRTGAPEIKEEPHV